MHISVMLILAACFMLGACCGPKRFTAAERQAIRAVSGSGPMRVLKTSARADSLRLRERSVRIGRRMAGSLDFALLCERMLATVNDPSDPGVGIAAPQAGVGRRLIAVQRTEKPGEPFECYVNPHIVRYGRDTASMREGCLSIPDRYEPVCRSRRIVVRYRDAATGKRRRETVEGLSAVIFQHEIDHLNGILFTDRTVMHNENRRKR